MEAAPLTPSPQTHCPVYLVNVSSMSAGDVIAAAKMQGRGHGWGPSSPTHVWVRGACVGTENPIDTGHRWALGRFWVWRDVGMDCGAVGVQRHVGTHRHGHRNSCGPVGPCPSTGEHTWAAALLIHMGHTQVTNRTHTQDTHGHTPITHGTHGTHRSHTGTHTHRSHTGAHTGHTGHTRLTHRAHTEDRGLIP